MIIKTKEYTVLDVEDLEKAVSAQFAQDCKIGQMDVTLYDCASPHGEFDGIYFTVHVDGCTAVVDGYEEDEAASWELAEKAGWETFDPDVVGLAEEFIFNFDTALFKSYKRMVDGSD